MRHFARFRSLLTRLGADDRGQDVIEYALLGSFVSLMGILGAGMLGTALNAWYDGVASNIDAATASGS
jgi:Flp pilus assembly pilin Flp